MRQNLTFHEFASINGQRARAWHPEFRPGLGLETEPLAPHAWGCADWANAAAGEMGEACNVVKKIRRVQTGHAGAKDPSFEELVSMLGDELADVFAYIDLLATFYDIDLEAAVIRKFNAVSEREGLPHRVGTGVEEPS